LHVCAGATLKFVTDSCRYLPPVLTRWEGVSAWTFAADLCMRPGSGWPSPAPEFSTVRRVRADGWHWAGPWEGPGRTGWTPGRPHQAAARANLMEWAAAGVPVRERVLTEGELLRPAFIEFFRCHDVLVEGVTVRNSPMWASILCFSRAVTVRRVQVSSLGPNNDGCVTDSCRDVLIEDCQFDTGDDCVAIKSGRNEDGRRVNLPAEDVVIRGLPDAGRPQRVAIGSEISGRVRRVFVEKCMMDSPNLDRAFRIKANSTRGGVVEQVYLRDIGVSRVREAAVRIDLRYAQAEEQGRALPTVRGLVIERWNVPEWPGDLD